MNFPIFPEQASTYAVKVDNIVLVLTALTIFFTGLVMALLIFFSIRYRRGSKADRSRPVHTHEWLEIGWSVPPLILGIGMFVWAVQPYAEVFNPPRNAEEIFVIGKRWMWHIEHANGIREMNELHVPIGRPFKLTIISQDVIHGFYIPDFRIKRDAMPGRYNTCWFQATRAGKYHLFCTEYCGTNHSQMGGWVYVMEPRDYEEWVKTGSSGLTPATTIRTPEQEGAELFNQLACGNCHRDVDTPRAPTLIGLYGRERRLQNGSTVIADDTYIRQVIRKPEENVLVGYVQNMPAYTDAQISEEQVHSLIAYIRSLGSVVPTHSGTGTTRSRTRARRAPHRQASRSVTGNQP